MTEKKYIITESQFDSLEAENTRLEGEMYELRNRLEQLDAENTRLKELLSQALDALKWLVSCVEHSTEFQLGNPAYEQAECLGKEIITTIEKEGIK